MPERCGRVQKGCIGIRTGITGNQDLVGEKMKQIFSFNKKEKGTGKKPVKKLILGAVLLVAVVGGAFSYIRRRPQPRVKRKPVYGPVR